MLLLLLLFFLLFSDGLAIRLLLNQGSACGASRAGVRTPRNPESSLLNPLKKTRREPYRPRGTLLEPIRHGIWRTSRYADQGCLEMHIEGVFLFSSFSAAPEGLMKGFRLLGLGSMIK